MLHRWGHAVCEEVQGQGWGRLWSGFWAQWYQPRSVWVRWGSPAVSVPQPVLQEYPHTVFL